MKPSLLFEQTDKNRIQIKVNLGKGEEGDLDVGSLDVGSNDSYFYKPIIRHSIKFNQGEDKEKYPFILPYLALNSFLDINRVTVNENPLEIDPNSIDVFYSYTDFNSVTTFLGELSPSAVQRWYELDCPDLYRYTVNKKDAVNSLGVRPITFEHKLTELRWNFLNASQDITKDEVDRLTKNKDSRISDALQSIWEKANK